MPQFLARSVLPGVFLALAAGCTTSDLGIEDTLSLADPDLPETVSAVPTLSMAPVSGALASAGRAAASVMPSAFAGPTPNDPAAGFVPSGRKVQARSPDSTR